MDDFWRALEERLREEISTRSNLMGFAAIEPQDAASITDLIKRELAKHYEIYRIDPTM